MKIPANKLTDHVISLISQLRDIQIQAGTKNLASVDIDEEITISVQLVSEWNSVERRSNGATTQTQTEKKPATTRTTTTGKKVSKSVADAHQIEESGSTDHTQNHGTVNSGVNSSTTVQDTEYNVS